MEQKMNISDIKTASGREYSVDVLESGKLQYMDSGYKFAWVPDDMKGCLHLRTCGNDKLINEDEICVSFNTDRAVDVYIIFADKFPVIPNWLENYERVRKNVTRQDSEPETLKGYFSMYKKTFEPGKIILNGCSPKRMLSKHYIVTMGATYCMYTVCFKTQKS